MNHAHFKLAFSTVITVKGTGVTPPRRNVYGKLISLTFAKAILL